MNQLFMNCKEELYSMDKLPKREYVGDGGSAGVNLFQVWKEKSLICFKELAEAVNIALYLRRHYYWKEILLWKNPFGSFCGVWTWLSAEGMLYPVYSLLRISYIIMMRSGDCMISKKWKSKVEKRRNFHHGPNMLLWQVWWGNQLSQKGDSVVVLIDEIDKRI